jgi:hypothetical protein
MTTQRDNRLGNDRAGLFVLIATLAAPACVADDAAIGGFALRNQNPFLQIFGLPVYQTADLVTPGHPEWNISFDLANHADAGETDFENFSIDGETYFLTLSMRRRVMHWLELGFDVPFLSHSDGFMDNVIEGWHDLLGISNTKRSGPSNQLAFFYELEGEELYRLDSPTSGLGDIQLTAAVPLREGEDGRSRIAIRSSVKLPTGDADDLLGSGGTDFALGVYWTGTSSLLDRGVEWTGFAGGLALGDGDVLPDLQNSFVAFGGAGVNWQVWERIDLAAQLYAQQPFFDSGVEELGGSSVQLTVGGLYRTRNNTRLRLAIVEDVIANATPDFAVHFSVTFGGG